MKKLIVSFCCVLSLSLIGRPSQATPVSFTVDGFGSSVVLPYSTGIGPASIESLLVLNHGQEFTVDDNQTFTLDFFNLTVNGWGIGKYQIEATLAFETPDINASSTGVGYYGSLFGIQGGTLDWDDNTLPDVFTVDGNTISISFEEGIAIGCGDTATVHAYVTNLGNNTVPTPEPTTILLLGSGLVGLAGFRKRLGTSKSR